MNSFLDWLDEAAGGFIRLAYLVAGITAVAVYFGAGAMPPLVDAFLNAGLPWALAFALETHTYLTSRRVRAAWQERDRGALTVNAVVLALLLSFGAWNQLGYLSGTWTPPHAGVLALPTWLAYAVRALIVPVAFMAAAFLAPLAPPITAQIEGEARATLADVFKIARKQRKVMLREAEAAGRDLTGALVELVPDDETRRIISHAYGAIRPPTGGDAHGVTAEAALAAVARDLRVIYPTAANSAGIHLADLDPDTQLSMSASQDLQAVAVNDGDAPDEPPDDDLPPPDDTPRRTRRPSPPAANVTQMQSRVRRRGLGAGLTGVRRTHGGSNLQSSAGAGGVRTSRKYGNGQSLEHEARSAWMAGAQTVKAMQSATGMGRSAASSWVRMLKAERARQEGA